MKKKSFVLLSLLLEGAWDYAYFVAANQMTGHSSTMPDGVAGTTLFATRDGRLECFYWEGDTCICIYLEKND